MQRARAVSFVWAALLTLHAAGSLAQITSAISLSSVSTGQTTLGEVLDRGGKRVTSEEFRRELVGTPVSGFSATGQQLDVVYIDGGAVRGAGYATVLGGAKGGGQSFSVEGLWNIDDMDRVCVAMRYGSALLPLHCQFWFRDDRGYFLSESDTDRSAKVLRRTVSR